MNNYLYKKRIARTDMMNKRFYTQGGYCCNYKGGYAGRAGAYNQTQKIFNRVFSMEKNGYTEPLDLTGGMNNFNNTGVLQQPTKYNKRPIYQVGNYIPDEMRQGKVDEREQFLNVARKRVRMFNVGILSQ